LQRVRDKQPDLVLLDLMLPGKDGAEVCRTLDVFSELWPVAIFRSFFGTAPLPG
jgi:CheY-like chemotaxis protein